MAKKKIKEESTVDTTLSFEQRVANKLGLSEQDNTLIKKANESPETTDQNESHFCPRAFMQKMQTVPL
jgi:hypothetical protein